MDTLPKKVIVETLASSEEYAKRLHLLMKTATEAETQVHKSALTAEQNVLATFKALEDEISVAIKTRKTELLQKIRRYESESLLPLTLCKQEINDRIAANNDFNEMAKQVLKIGGFRSEEMCYNFIDRSSAMGTLPAVPDLELVPNITFHGATDQEIKDITSSIDGIGRVYKIGRVQIISIDPHPGSLLVRWEDIDSENQTDIFCYRLQIARCDSKTANDSSSNLFQDAYIGQELNFLIRDLRKDDTYCFRVCCRISDDSDWSSWSMIKAASTHLRPFVWNAKNEDYLISNDGKLATATTNNDASVLYSAEPQVENGFSIRFTFLARDGTAIDTDVGLSVTNSHSENQLQQKGALCVTSNGDIFIDGKKKVISFPRMERNSMIIFSCDMVNEKCRINIESGDSCVTYEWLTNCEKLFFAAILRNRDTQVLVE